MENDYKQEVEKERVQEQVQEQVQDKNPYEEQLHAQQLQIDQLQAQISANSNSNNHGSNNSYEQSHNPYKSNGAHAKNSNDPYARMGDRNKQNARAKNLEHVNQAVGVGVVGALAMTTKTAALGAVVAKGAAGAGLTGIAALGSLPVAGPLLLGGAAVIAGTVATVIAGKAIVGGVKALMGAGKGAQRSISNYKPERHKSNNQYQNIQQQANKVDAYIKQAKKDFVEKKDIGGQVKDMANLKGLSAKQKKKVSNLYGDNQIRNSAQAKGGKVNEFGIMKQVMADAKEQGWNKSQTAKMFNSVKNRIETQKDKQNITKDGKVLSVKKEDLKQKSQKQSTVAVAQKTQMKAVNNVKFQTANAGKSVVKSVKKASPQQSPAKPQQAAAKAQSASSSNDYHSASRGK